MNIKQADKTITILTSIENNFHPSKKGTQTTLKDLNQNTTINNTSNISLTESDPNSNPQNDRT